MKPVLRFILSALLVIAAQPSALAMTLRTLDCDGGIVYLGDFAPNVMKKCGQPAYSVQREQKIVQDNSIGDGIITTSIIDDWTFNFGPTRFQYRVLLRDGRVWQIECMDYYGY
jgi:hypothetical protein